MDSPSHLKLNTTLNFYLIIILLIAFVDFVGIGLVYPIFAVLLFDPNNLIVPANSSPEFRGAMLGILISANALFPVFPLPCFRGIF